LGRVAIYDVATRARRTGRAARPHRLPRTCVVGVHARQYGHTHTPRQIHKTIRQKETYNVVCVMDDYEELMRGADPRAIAKAKEGQHWDITGRFFIWREPETGYFLGEKLYDVPEDNEGALYSFPADSPLIWNRCFN
jgi:hypothetical protein